MNTIANDKPESAIAALIKREFPGMSFTTQDRKSGGIILKSKGGEAAALEFLRKRQRPKGSANVKPPAKCNIVAMSRPLTEWPLYQVSMDVQRHVYSLTKTEFETMEVGTTEDFRNDLLRRIGSTVDPELIHVQGFNLILKQARNRYKGVITKVANLNAKNLARQERDPDYKYVEEHAFGEDGRLKKRERERGADTRDPIGINPNLYMFANVAPKPWDGRGIPDSSLPEALRGYNRDPKAPLSSDVPDRLAIPKGQPGYVPDHQRRPGGSAGMVKEGGSARRRRHYARQNHKPKPPKPGSKGRTSIFDPAALERANLAEAILAIVRVKDDWALIDLRGLLRHVRYRGIEIEGGVTTGSLLTLFTGDVVLDTRRNIATFLFKEGVVDVRATNPVIQKYGPERLGKLVDEHGAVAVVGVDLGQKHPVAYGIARVTRKEDGSLSEDERITSDFLPPEFIVRYTAIGQAHDTLEQSIRVGAEASLTEGQREEIRRWRADSPEDTKRRLCAQLAINPEDIPWDRMTTSSTFLADLIIARGGDTSIAYFERKEEVKDPPKRKNAKKQQPRKRFDRRFLGPFRAKLDGETRKALNQAEWSLKRHDDTYDRHPLLPLIL